MPENKTDRTISLEQFNQELNALKNVNNTIKEICAKLKENDKKEEKALQIRSSKLQTVCLSGKLTLLFGEGTIKIKSF